MGITEIHGFPIRAELPVPDSGETIVLLEYEDARSSDFQNLLRVTRDAEIRWRAEYPESDKPADAYVSVRWEGDTLHAQSWSGLVVELDPETGRIRSQSLRPV